MSQPKRIGYELPGHPNQCDCPLCEQRLEQYETVRSDQEQQESG
jgi:hypothetical protein